MKRDASEIRGAHASRVPSRASRPRTLRYEKRGFALVLILALAAIVVLLGASLVSLNQIETASRAYKSNVRTARDNARAALEMALADLQQFAGRDQTVTALADGFRPTADEDFKDAASDDFHPFWTGVWDNDSGTSDTPVWLVTRPATGAVDPTASLGAAADEGIGFVRVVSAATAAARTTDDQVDFDVKVPLESIRIQIGGGEEIENKLMGKYGYWVGDLGVKANYAIPYRQDEVVHDGYNADSGGSMTRLRQMIPHYHRMKGIGPRFNQFDQLESDTNLEGGGVKLGNRSIIDRLLSDFQLRAGVAADTSLLNEVSMGGVREYFHDFTTVTHGVLVDTMNGGLRIDLSPLSPVGESAVDNDLIPHANPGGLTITEPTPLTRRYAIAPEVPGTSPTIAPVVTEFHIDFRAYVERQGENAYLRITYNAGVELWNPFSSALDSGSLQLAVESVPGGSIIFTSNGASADPGPYSMSIPIQMIPSVADSWRPGQVIAFTGAGSFSIGPGHSSRSAASVSAPVAIDASPTDPLDDYFALSVDSGPISISLKDSAGNTLRSYSIGFDSAIFSDLVFSMEGGPYQSRLFGYSWEVDDPTSSGVSWFDYEPRANAVPTTLLNQFSSDPKASQNTSSSNLFQDGSVVLLGYNPTEGALVNAGYDIPMFELPRQDVLSLGQLQHAHFSSGVPRDVGRSGSAINSVFDEHFFSSVPTGSTDWTVDAPLPNTRIQIMEGTAESDVQSQNSAQHLLIKGMLNVNSTSLDAWMAILRGIDIEEWEHHDPSAPGTPLLEDFDSSGDRTEFFYFAQSAEETWHTGTGLPYANLRKSYRMGIKSLSNAQVEELARQIVIRVRDRIASASGPFTSLREFIDEGVLAQSITAADAVLSAASEPMINNPVTNPQPGAPSYLTQNTLLSSLAPFLAVRSDTFLIRAYGDARDAEDETNVLARAYCEAVVQRFPQKHPTDGEKDDAMTATTTGPTEYGRQFKIIAFRWLTPEEI